MDGRAMTAMTADSVILSSLMDNKDKAIMQMIAEDKELEADLKITQEGVSKCSFKRNFVYFAQNRQIILFL